MPNFEAVYWTVHCGQTHKQTYKFLHLLRW